MHVGRFSTVNFVRHAIWHMSAERISWLVLFPLQLWFALQSRWVACGICVAGSILVLTFRQTIGNIRVIALMRARQSEQRALDREAEEYVRTLTSGRSFNRRPLILFLRPFSGDREVRGKEPSSPDGYDVAPLEARLAAGFAHQFATLSFRGRLDGRNVWGDAYVSMGPDITPYHPDFYKYAGRLFYARPGEIEAPESNWFNTFRLLARNARLIVSVPIDASQAPEQSATILELLDLRANDMIERCVFVMPPEQSLWLLRPSDETPSHRGTDQMWTTREVKLSSLWESTRKKLARSGIEFPEFKDTMDGATLFILRGNECRLSAVAGRELSNPGAYMAVLNIKLPTS